MDGRDSYTRGARSGPNLAKMCATGPFVISATESNRILAASAAKTRVQE
jgi:hypothetical protein